MRYLVSLLFIDFLNQPCEVVSDHNFELVLAYMASFAGNLPTRKELEVGYRFQRGDPSIFSTECACVKKTTIKLTSICGIKSPW